MSVEDFIIAVFCVVDDELKKMLNGQRLRQRGPAPGLQGSEVITMEIVGKFWEKIAINPSGSISGGTGHIFF